MHKKNKAFTLTELLVVVIVLGVLAAVAVPKFTRVLETRRTTEAENMLSAVRMEQEKRCSLGQNYTGDFGKIETVAYARTGEGQAQSANYTYALTATGASASREGKEYVLKMPSYKSGEICCEGEGCESLNKSYRPCSEVTVEVDECAATDVVIPEPEPSGPCDIDPDGCECNPNQSKCCASNEEWNGSMCEPKDECVESIGNASSASASMVDTCDGDKTSRYTCDGHFKGTCTDVYTNSLQAHVDENGALVSGVAKLASYEKDPFLAFKNSIWLAANTGQCAGGVYCGSRGTTACCCPKGYYCDMSEALGGCGTCKEGEMPPQSKDCLVGYYWDEERQQCVEEVHVCVEGYRWDAISGKCVVDEEADTAVDEEQIVSLYMKREVTCCGDGKTTGLVPGTGVEYDPAADCEKSCGFWNAFSKTCTPKTCGTGLTLNTSTCKCESTSVNCLSPGIQNTYYYTSGSNGPLESCSSVPPSPNVIHYYSCAANMASLSLCLTVSKTVPSGCSGGGQCDSCTPGTKYYDPNSITCGSAGSGTTAYKVTTYTCFKGDSSCSYSATDGFEQVTSGGKFTAGIN